MENTQQPPHCIWEWCYSEVPLNSVEFHPFSWVKSKEFGLTPIPKGRKAAAIHPSVGFGSLHPHQLFNAAFHNIRCFSQAMSDEDT